MKKIINKIGIIDADLIDKGTTFPNLALMKISSFYKDKHCSVKLLLNYDDIKNYDKVYISKVFDFTACPFSPESNKNPNIILGGTGFFFDKSPKLDINIENSMPDYSLYPIEKIQNIKKKFTKDYYIDYSIGFITRGCFRKCKFCVNRNYSKVEKAGEIEDFLDKEKKYICLLDDNFFGYSNWKEEFIKLNKTKKPFQFKQGLDIRLLTEEKAKMLSECKYKGDYIFAFDDYEEREVIENKIQLWIKHWKFSKHRTKFYVLCGFKSQDITDIVETFERVKILFKHKCYPYIMKFKDYEKSEWKSIYTSLAGWCNQQHLLTKMSFREYCVLKGMGEHYKKYRNDWEGYVKKGYRKYKCWRELEKFEKKYPEIANKYFDLKWGM